MKEYYGTKKIQAEREDRFNASSERGLEVTHEGYKVVYPDGYESWSPKEAFEAAYRESGRMNFGHALEALKEGRKVARSGWNGKGMWIILVEGSRFDEGFKLRPDSAYAKHVTLPVTIRSHIDMRCADGTMQPGWQASQSDMLAEDWFIVE